MAARIGGLCLVVGLSACGARTSLEVDDPPGDGGTRRDAPGFDAPGFDAPGFDAPGFDAPPVDDAGTDAPAAFAIDCTPPQMVNLRETATVEAVVTRGALLEGRWRVVDAPGEVTLGDPGAARTRVASAAAGGVTLAYEAVSVEGIEARCESFVAFLDGDPVASCPGETILVPAGEIARVDGAGFDAEGPVEFLWEVVEEPRDASYRLFIPPTNPTAELQPATAGTYVLRLTVTDTSGNTDRCRATVRALAPPVLECPAPIRAPTRQPVSVTIEGTDDTAIVEHRWRPVRWPFDDVGIEIVELRDNTLTMIPRRRGEYALEYTAVDDDGLESMCLVRIIGTPTPPTLTCPEEVVIPPLRSGDVEATVEDDGDVTVRWTLEEAPEGSAAAAPTPRNALRTNFTPDIAGEYRLRIVATDDDRMTAECFTRVLAVSDEGLRVEMFWDSDGTDMDMHLLNPEATSWFNSTDCYYANCIGGLMWGMPGGEDDPSLDIDDRDGLGPENTNIETPYAGTYRVGVHAWSGTGAVTVRVYCGGSRTEPVAEYGPVTISSSSGQFWRVADVEITGPARCEVTELLGADGMPAVSTRDDAEATR